MTADRSSADDLLTAANAGNVSPLRAIDLARRTAFRIGEVEVRPATLELVAGDQRHSLEPRLMQVLVTLADAGGEPLTRTRLTELCWEGRIVGDDAMNRVIYRLRAVARATGAFDIETIAKIGYRLVIKEARLLPARRLGRRALIAGAGVTALAAAGAVAWWTLGPDARRSREAADILRRGDEAFFAHGADRNTQAISLYRLVIEKRPDDAKAWGRLALAYWRAWDAISGAAEAPAFWQRAHAAARRALALDPDNADGDAALAFLRLRYRNWADAEAAVRAAGARHPDHWLLLAELVRVLADTGRMAAGMPICDRLVALEPYRPGALMFHTQLLWANGRLEEADRAIDSALERWPRHYALWFMRLYLYAFTGETAAALAFGDDGANRPVGIPEWNFDAVMQAMRALHSRARHDIDKAVATQLDLARKGAGFAENAVTFCAATGRLDDAFKVLDAYYFSRGFVVPGARFVDQNAFQTKPTHRNCNFLFMPNMANARADPRFETLVREIDLDAFWRAQAIVPDYRRA